jgi:ribonucleoside-diphosphate reductase alpha chain
MRRDDNGHILDGNIENAPHLKEEHKAIFDTANKCGSGKRFIHYMGHLKMMAALQPHLSGAISKTINLPNDATLKDVSDVYTEGYRLGLKSLSLFRDGCKATQILTTSIKDHKSNDYESLTYKELVDELKMRDAAKPESITSIQRARPEGILKAHRHPVQINELKLYVIVSFYNNSNQICELFIEGGKTGSLVRGLLDDLSKTISRMLQYGVPPQEVARIYRGQRYEPSGFVSGHPYIRTCTSITDLISKIIDIELGDYSRCQVKPAGEACSGSESMQPEERPVRDHPAIEPDDKPIIIRGEHFCSNCHSDVMQRNGTCMVCLNCGQTTGCSG